MSCRVDTTPLLAGACVVSAYAGHGVRGDQVPSTGSHGPSPIFNDLVLPGDASKEYRWAITSPPATGTLVPYEDGSYVYTPPGGTVDLAAYYTYRLWEDGVDLGTATELIVIGSPALTLNLVAANCTQTNVSSAGAITVGGPPPVNLVAANSAQSNSSSAGAITIDGAAPINLIAVNSTQANSSAGGAVSMSNLPPAALPGYTAVARPRRANKPTAFDVKDSDETIWIAFDFRLVTSVISNVSITTERYSGAADATPSAILSGSPQIVGTKALQLIVAGADACTYHFECLVDTADGSRFSLAALLPIRSA